VRRTPIAGCIATAVLALAAAGCGGTSQPPVAAIANRGCGGPRCVQPATASEAVAASKAARCMRAHGVPNFPDPNSLPGVLKGHFGFTAGSGIDPDTPQFEAAYTYCGKRYLHMHTATPAQRARWNAAAVAYSHCMRAHGVSDFPDPLPGQGAIRLPTSEYENTPKVQRGMQACKSLFGKGFVFVVPIAAN
jgi:hypothetical protein